MPPVRFRAFSFLLTYSQVQNASLFTDERTAHFDFVSNALGPPLHYRLGREFHEDGGIHFHAFVSFRERVSFRDHRLLDFHDNHPNIQTVPRTPWRSWDYAGKSDDIIHQCGDGPPRNRADTTGSSSPWADAVCAEDKDSFYRCIRENAPRDYVLYFDALERFAERHFAKTPDPYESPHFTTVGYDRVSDWVEQSGINESTTQFGGRRKSLILWGPTRTGKTVWARSLGRYVTLLTSLQ